MCKDGFVLFIKIIKKDMNDPITLNDLPNDMIDTMTSFLNLIDIINMENTCKLFQQICKRNTYQLPVHIDTASYSPPTHYNIKYIEHYKKQLDKQSNIILFKLNEIKRLKLFIGSLNELETFNSIIKFHTHLTFLAIAIEMSFTFSNDLSMGKLKFNNLCDAFAVNIPLNVTINFLHFTYNYNVSLLEKALRAEQVEFYGGTSDDH